MKKYTPFVRTFALVALLFGVPALLFAADFRSGDQVSVKSTETVAEDLYMAGGTITSAGSVTGDLYAGGGTVLISGAVSEDLVAGGGTVTVLGPVGDDVRIGGGTVLIQGTVGGDAVVGGGQIHLTGSRIEGDVLMGGGSIRIDASVGGDVKIGGDEVYINAPVAGNVEVHAEKLTLGSEARIAGNLKYRSPKEATLEAGATVVGTTTYEPAKDRDGRAMAAAFLSALALAKLCMLLAGAFFFALVFRRFAEAVTKTAALRPLLEIGRGFVFLIVAPVLSVLLLVTIVGMPLGLLGLLSYGALMIVSCLVAPIVLGSLLYQWFSKKEREINWKTVLIGVFAVFLLGFIPILGGLINFILVLLTLGAVVKIKWDLIKEWR